MDEVLNQFIRENYSPWQVREFTKSIANLESSTRDVARYYHNKTGIKLHPIILEGDVKDSLTSYSDEIANRLPIARGKEALELSEKAVAKIQDGFSQRIKALKTGKPNIDKHIIESKLRSIRTELNNSVIIICEMIAAEKTQKQPSKEKLDKYNDWKHDCITAARDKIEGRISELQKQIQEAKQPKARKATRDEVRNTRPSDATRIHRANTRAR